MYYVTSSRRNRRRGVTLAYIVLCLTALLGVMAVSLDGGALLAERRHGQVTADAAALAAAADLFKNYATNAGADPSNTAKTSATTTASANGYTGSNSTITVRRSGEKYLGGPRAGANVPAGYAEVTVTYNQGRFFSSMWSSSAISVSARAVGLGKSSPGSPAILVLKPTGSGTLSTNGNGDITVSRAAGTTSGGNIIVDSNSSSAITLSGKNALVTDPDGILVSGAAPGYSGNGTISPAPVTGQSPTADPYRLIPEPSVPANAPSSTTANGVTTYYPGYYPSGLSLTGGYTAVFQSGLYYMNGTFKVNGNGSSSLTGTGVTIFADASASIDIGGNGNVTLTPQTSGTYSGMIVFQSRSNTSDVKISGNGSVTSIAGTIYAPDATLSLQGNGGSVGSQIVANQVSAGGNGTINVTYDNQQVAKTRILNLVE
jgi:Flp pilus assembly protein TadG